MKLSDKVMIIMVCIATLLIMWHVFAPKEMQIDGFYGYPLYFCMFLMGYGPEKIDIQKKLLNFA